MLSCHAVLLYCASSFLCVAQEAYQTQRWYSGRHRDNGVPPSRVKAPTHRSCYQVSSTFKRSYDGRLLKSPWSLLITGLLVASMFVNSTCTKFWMIICASTFSLASEATAFAQFRIISVSVGLFQCALSSYLSILRRWYKSSRYHRGYFFKQYNSTPWNSRGKKNTPTSNQWVSRPRQWSYETLSFHDLPLKDSNETFVRYNWSLWGSAQQAASFVTDYSAFFFKPVERLLSPQRVS